MVGLYVTAHRYVRARRGLGEHAPLTARHTGYVLDGFVNLIGPEFPVARLHRRHIEKWLLAQTCGESTKRNRYSTVKTFCKWMVDHDLIRKDPCRGIRGPREKERVPRAFTDEQVRNLLEHVPDERGIVCCLLSLQEGLRCAEICRVRTEDIDYDDRSILVHGKGDKERVVPLSDQTLEAIDVYLGVWPAGPHQPLIRSYLSGKAICGVTLTRLVSGWMRDAGLKRRAHDGKSLHALRHTAACDVYETSKDPKAVQEFLGHANLSTTDRYLRRTMSADRLRDATGGRRYG
jgi:integrase/recombinase XerC